MNPLTEQQIDAEVSRYEPGYDATTRTYYWSALYCHTGRKSRTTRVASPFWGLLKSQTIPAGFRDYPTREAAFADLRRAIRAANAQEQAT